MRVKVKLIGLFLLAVLWGCNEGGSGGTPDTPEALRNAIPEHGGNPGPQAETTYVGRVDGTDALIAVVANDLAGTAYICDGAEVSEWFLGIPNGAELHLDGGKSGSIDAEIAGDSVNGEVMHAGANHPFSTMVAVERESGIYRSVWKDEGERIVTGWIYFDGELRGADENPTKIIVGTIAIDGIRDGTGSGTGLGPVPTPAPVPVFDCNETWCNFETKVCFITFMLEEIKKIKDKQLLRQANAMLAAAKKELDQIGNDLTNNNCAQNGSACHGTGYDSGRDIPCCNAEGCGG